MSDERSINPTALTPLDLARLLTRAGAPAVGEEQIRSDLAHGAPANPDGTINLIHYTAWLVREAGQSES